MTVAVAFRLGYVKFAVPEYLKGPSLNEIRKFVVALIGVCALAVSQGLIVGTAAKWSGIIVAAFTAAGVYIVPNDPA